jgi:sulfide:quinone oxidoreductase
MTKPTKAGSKIVPRDRGGRVQRRRGEAPDGARARASAAPATTAVGKAILAEFIYGGKVTPTLPLNPAKEHWIGWWIKVTGLPLMYWNYMLKGHVWCQKHNTAFKGDVA